MGGDREEPASPPRLSRRRFLQVGGVAGGAHAGEHAVEVVLGEILVSHACDVRRRRVRLAAGPQGEQEESPDEQG